MKKPLMLSLFISLTLLFACQKDQVLEKTTQAPELKYEVITASGKWFGEWDNDKAERVYISKAPLGESGWTYTFTPKALPFTMVCHATGECLSGLGCATQDVTVNLYVNGIKVKTETNNWAKGVTTATFKVE